MLDGDERGAARASLATTCTVDTEHHLIVTHEVTNSGSDRSQLADRAKQAKAVLLADLTAVEAAIEVMEMALDLLDREDYRFFFLPKITFQFSL